MSNSGEIEQMIEDCENRSEKLSDRESEFIEDISKRLRHGGSLTVKQLNWLNDIWDRVT